jgi:hypothetical protein
MAFLAPDREWDDVDFKFQTLAMRSPAVNACFNTYRHGTASREEAMITAIYALMIAQENLEAKCLQGNVTGIFDTVKEAGAFAGLWARQPGGRYKPLTAEPEKKDVKIPDEAFAKPGVVEINIEAIKSSPFDPTAVYGAQVSKAIFDKAGAAFMAGADPYAPFRAPPPEAMPTEEADGADRPIVVEGL